jgi:hypothetical protein
MVSGSFTLLHRCILVKRFRREAQRGQSRQAQQHRRAEGLAEMLGCRSNSGFETADREESSEQSLFLRFLRLVVFAGAALACWVHCSGIGWDIAPWIELG